MNWLPRHSIVLWMASCLVIFAGYERLYSAPPPITSVSLQKTLDDSAIRDVALGEISIIGEATESTRSVQVRVLDSFGKSYAIEIPVVANAFHCRFPTDFSNASPIAPSILYVEASDQRESVETPSPDLRAEILLVVADRKQSRWPDLPLGFMDDFISADQKKDTESSQWNRQRALINNFMHSRASQLMGLYRRDFDLANPSDFSWFQNNASLYDFDHRDRDWSESLGSRTHRGFWQAVWDTWFNPSNDHPWDGNPKNVAQENYRPYTFTNDAADLLIVYEMLRKVTPVVADNREELANDVLSNLLAMQHQSHENFALTEVSGKQEFYTAGAFRCGMFESGEWLTEEKGWFVNPEFRDFARGGVFNGRAAWALGESLKASPNGRQSTEVANALKSTIRYCLCDGLEHGYTRRTASGLPLWNQRPGEQAYLALGMLAASEVAPDMPVVLKQDQPPRRLIDVTADALDAIVEIANADGNWTHYANAAAMNIASLAEGARTLPDHPSAPRWKAAAMRAADLWIGLKPAASARPTMTPMFGHIAKDGTLTFYLGKAPIPHVALYVGGHWLHALAVLYAVTNETRYLDRAEAILTYYCGRNPLNIRLLNELGAVNNRVSDVDQDGIEDTIHWDAYPESTAFVQIGLLHLLRARRLESP